MSFNSNLSKIKDLDSLFFEVGCIECGKISYNLPYIKDTYHIITCQNCKQVSIFNILPNGSLVLKLQNIVEKNEQLNILKNILLKSFEQFELQIKESFVDDDCNERINIFYRNLAISNLSTGMIINCNTRFSLNSKFVKSLSVEVNIKGAITIEEFGLFAKVNNNIESEYIPSRDSYSIFRDNLNDLYDNLEQLNYYPLFK